MITMRTSPLEFWRNTSSYRKLKPLAQVILSLPGSAIENERLWKSQNENFEGFNRGRLGLEVGAAQTWLAEIFKTVESVAHLDNHPLKCLEYEKLY
jgi:hypothetical protein